MVLLPPPGDPSVPFACRILPHTVADGATQMALDEALLDSVAEGASGIAIRTYEWSVPTLSLGYFQHWRDVASAPRWRDLPVVRRPTGGGALWHDHEITYALVIPRTHPLAHPSSALYRAVHEAIAAHLRREGWQAARRETVGATLPALAPSLSGSRPFLCFLDHDGQDVVVDQAKVVGSAQRRRAGAVLQHGSILLARSATTPELPGLADIGGPDGNPSQIPADEVSKLLVAALGGSALFQDWTDRERHRADVLRQEQYAHRAWIERR